MTAPNNNEFEVPEYILALRDEYKEFTTFLTDAWTALGLPSPTIRQYEMGEFMQYGGDALFIAGQRGLGKSWVAGAYGDWRLLRDFSCNVFSLSAAKDKAEELSVFAKRLFSDPRLPHLNFMAPGPNSRDNITRWDTGMAPNMQMPSWRAIGVDGQVQGSRSNVALLDDVETLANSKTPAAREHLIKQASDCASTVKPDDPTGQVIWLGTYQSTESMYKVLAERGVRMQFWPSRYPKPDEIKIYKGCLAPAITKELRADPALATAGFEGRGAPVDEQRFSDAFLMSRERLLGKAQYRLQFQLDPSMADVDKYPLRMRNVPVTVLDRGGVPEEFHPSTKSADLADDIPCLSHSDDQFFRPARLDGPVSEYKPLICAIDPSGKGGDETAWVIAGVACGRMFVPHWDGRTDGASQKTMRAIAESCKKYGVNEIVVESNFGGGTWTELLSAELRRTYPCTVTEVHAKGKKEWRIADALEPVVEARKLVLNESRVLSEFEWMTRQELPEAARTRCLVHQMSHLVREKDCLKFDDRVDALAIAAQRLLRSIGLDPEQVVSELRDARLEAELRDWQSGITGAAPKPNLWVSLPQ